MEETWKPVPYEGFAARYSVSNLGRVKPNTPSIYSKNKAEFLMPVASSRGYLFVTIYANGKNKSAFIHRMVALAFHGEPSTPNAYVCHRNDIQADNRAENLYWGNGRANCLDRARNGRDLLGVRNGRAILTEDDVRAIRERYASGGISQQALADEYGTEQTRISKIILRQSWKHIE